MGEGKMKRTEQARQLRRNQTDMEKKLWKYLRNRQLENCKFYRQYSIPPYFVDFICRDKKLIIEVDGGQHADRFQQDRKRTGHLEKKGYRVIRFWNNEVMDNIEGILHKILRELDAPLTPALSLKGEGDFKRMEVSK